MTDIPMIRIVSVTVLGNGMRVPTLSNGTQTWDDVISYDDADATDRAEMDKGQHYDYVAQCWVKGNDHAHYYIGNDVNDVPMVYCGADRMTCYGDHGQGYDGI